MKPRKPRPGARPVARLRLAQGPRREATPGGAPRPTRGPHTAVATGPLARTPADLGPAPARRLPARSVLAGGPAYLLQPGSLDPPPPARRPSPVRRRLAVVVLAGLVVGAAVVAFAGTRVVLAHLTDTAAGTGSTFATGAWAVATTWYLHNNPTPPTANTTAQLNLPLHATAPTATTLYNYDTNCDSRAGRRLTRGTGLVTETGSCRYATWRSAALASARTLTGSATLTAWARKTGTGGTAPTLRAFLRAFDPATSTYTELGAASVAVTANSTSPFAVVAPTWTLPGVTIPARQVVELKLVATGGSLNPEIAYDTTAYPSSLTLP